MESSVLTYSMKQHYWSKQSYLSTELKEQIKKVLNEEKNDKIKTLLRFANAIKTKGYNPDFQKFFAFQAK
ncbi:TPA: hypothetical protein DEG21_02575 [Patescibacteria group bacterium]|nr:hypothetical protein [Candidatus Gracilibacteria bacterium]HBY74760.1 hypothetical protein [Candidatus Gracilibacteria bacterium]